MEINKKKKYWEQNHIWNNGKYNYLVKSKNFKNENKTLSVLKILRIFKFNPCLFNSIKYFNIIRRARNIFVNISSLNGVVYKHGSCGMYSRRGSERRTFLAFNKLLEQTKILVNRVKEYNPNLNLSYIVRIRTNNFYKGGFKRNISTFLDRNKINVYKFIGIKCKAHNGIRKKKKKRK